MATHLRDEHGNPVELTDELGRPVKLTDDHGNPVHLSGVALTSSETTAPINTSTPSYGVQQPTSLGAAIHGHEAGPPAPGTLGAAMAGGEEGGHGQYQPRRETEVVGGVGGDTGEIQHSGYSYSSSSPESEEQVEGHVHEGGRKKKTGLGEKIKEKLMGGKHKDKDNKDTEQTATTTLTTTTTTTIEHHEGEHEKKGIMEKIKDKLPGTGHH